MTKPQEFNKALVQPSESGDKPGKRKRTWLWILLAFVVGVLTPLVTCIGLTFVIVGFAGSGDDIGFGPGVGVIEVNGVIVPGESSGFSSDAGSATIVNLIEQANADSNVKAIVLRVDSPGGGVVASDEIHHAITQVDKPVVVSMGTLAASGGYYISAPADYIYATPHTLTGSIGVISSFINAEELLDEVGVEVVVLTTGGFKDTGSYSRSMTQAEQEYWQAILDQTFTGFVNVVTDGRGLSEAEVLEFADGRVFTGQQALELGLVDELGYFEDAVNMAASLGGISGSPRIIRFESIPGLFDFAAGAQAQSLLPGAIEILELMGHPRLEYRYSGQ